MEQQVMERQTALLSPQEARLQRGDSINGGLKSNRERVYRMLQGFRDKPPQISIERAYYFTESFSQTEHLPLVLRWAKALQHIMKNISVAIDDDDIIVGRCGPLGRYGVIYPELRAGWFSKGLKDLPNRKEASFLISDKDIQIVNKEIAPYWKGKTLHESYYNILPEDTRRIMYKSDTFSSTGIMQDLNTLLNTMNWNLDYNKVINIGFNGIRKQAEERINSLDPMDPKNNFDKLPFLKAVIIVCDAMDLFAKRYADVARKMAEKEPREQRKNELFEIAAVCDWVPANPARNFREAIQAQWFANVAGRLEQLSGGPAGNGRIDQYLNPFYVKDLREGRITKEGALELLECLWLNMAQMVRLIQTSESIGFWEGYVHNEHTTISGQTKDGLDATNETTYLVLQSKREFPLDYPDLSVRIHSQTPERLLLEVCEAIKEGTGFPKLMNDEAIIPLLLAKGATLEEARDYCGSGCVQVRMQNRDTYMSLGAHINLAAALDMALNDGKLRQNGNDRFGVPSGDPRKFQSFEDLMTAFKFQVENLLKHFFIKQYIADTVRPTKLAAPLMSCLHDLCMKQCKDIHQGTIEGATKIGNCFPVGYGTVVDSLAAIKKLVFDDKKISMDRLIEALDTNFEGNEVIRQMCLNAPKYGNNDTYVDSIGHEIEGYLVSYAHRYTNLYGGPLDIDYTPVTAHVPLGRAIGATPNGRKAGEALSEGISPSQGCDLKGPTATLLSVARGMNTRYENRAARLLNMKLSPQAVAGEEGTRNLASLIRTWCDQKHWHIQFNIINNATLKEAKKHPEKYRNLLIRVAGYSAYFVDLSSELQDEIIRRTEHSSI